MKRPSERALDLANEIMDYVHHGLSRAEALYELADMIDESNGELVQAIQAALQDAARDSGQPSPEALAHLRVILRDYLPLRPAAGNQRELFSKQPATLF